jgi:hypothetical protein
MPLREAVPPIEECEACQAALAAGAGRVTVISSHRQAWKGKR